MTTPRIRQTAPLSWGAAHARKPLRLLLLIAVVLASIAQGSGAPRVAAVCLAQAPKRVQEATAIRILETERPFQPTDLNLFLDFAHDAHDGYQPPEMPKSDVISESETQSELQAFLERRFPCNPERVKAGMDVYANPIARLKLPDPPLRAALAALTGTLGEPAIDYLLYSAPITLIHFNIVITSHDGLPIGTAAATYDLPDGTRQIVFDREFRFNHFTSLSALLLHESLHVEEADAIVESADRASGAGHAEETIASAFESIVYMQMLLTDADIARLPDLLTRGSNNRQALALLNSATPGTASINLSVPNGEENIDPLSKEPLTQFLDVYPALGTIGDDLASWTALETEGNPLLRAMAAELVGDGDLSAIDFDRSTLALLDQHLGALTASELIVVACALELDIPCD